MGVPSLFFKDRLFGVMFEPLKDFKYFAKVSLDEMGAVCWPNDADLDSESLHQKIMTNLL